MKLLYRILVISGLVLVVSACNFGAVDEGRTVKYEKDQKKVTIIRDVSTDKSKPKYDMPPLSFRLPDNPNEMGPEPKAGGRLNLDVGKNEITILNPATQKIETLKFTLIEKKENIEKNDPLVFDKAQNKPKKFPVVNRDKKTITVYSSRQKLLVTFSLSDEYFTLPDETWDAGDVLRIYHKEGGKANRIMNVTRTDIYKK